MKSEENQKITVLWSPKWMQYFKKEGEINFGLCPKLWKVESNKDAELATGFVKAISDLGRKSFCRMLYTEA